MRFVAIKSETQQAAAGLHKLRALLVKQRTMVSNQLRGLLAEFGVVTAKGPGHVGELAALAAALAPMAALWRDLERRNATIDRQILDWAAATRPSGT